MRSYVFLWVLGFVLLHAATDARNYDSDTQQVVEEMDKLFRKLFPFIIDRSEAYRRTHFSEPLKSKDPEDDFPRGLFYKKHNQYRADEDFRKRGANCMKKCISQGILHPLQCHSLC